MLTQNIHKNLKLNIVFNAIYQVLILIIPFITSPYISRVLLTEGYGSYSYSYSTVTYFVTLSTFGFLDYGTVAIAKKREDKAAYTQLFWELFIVKGVLALLVSGIYLGLVAGGVFLSSSYPLNTKMVYLILGLDVLSSVFDITFLFQGLENFVSLCLRNLLIKLLNLVLIFTLVKTASDYQNFVWVMSGCLFLTGFSTLIAIPQYLGKIHFHRFNPWYHLKSSFKFFLPYIATSVYNVASKTFLGSMIQDPNVSGYYEAADKLITIIVGIVASINTIMMSRMSYLYETKQTDEIKKKTAETLELYLVVGIPAFFGLVGVNQFFTPGFFGDSYAAAVPLVYILAFKVLIVPISGILGSIYFVPANHIWRRNIYLIAGACFSLLTNYVFIRFLGIDGAALSSTLTELLVTLLFVSYAKREVNFSTMRTPGIQCFDAALMMFVLLWVLGERLGGRFSAIVTSIILIIGGILVYGVLLLLFRESLVVSTLSGYWAKIKARRKK